MSDDGFDPSDLLIGEGEESVTTKLKETLFGTQKELFTCPECNVACEESMAYNPETAAFDGGACPSWECPECGRHYVREGDEETYALDLYDRG